MVIGDWGEDSEAKGVGVRMVGCTLQKSHMYSPAMPYGNSHIHGSYTILQVKGDVCGQSHTNLALIIHTL